MATITASHITQVMRTLVPQPVRLRTQDTGKGTFVVTVPMATSRQLGDAVWLADYISRHMGRPGSPVPVKVTGPHMGRADVRGQSARYWVAIQPTCSHCGRLVFTEPDGTLNLVYREYDRTTLCDARGMDEGHEAA